MSDQQDDYADVRQYDPGWDDIAAELSPDELAKYADHVRDTAGFTVWRLSQAFGTLAYAWWDSIRDNALARSIRRTD